ncbi:ph-response sensor protein [Rhizina undulata]
MGKSSSNSTSPSPSRPSLLHRLKSKTSSLGLPGFRSPRRSLADFHIRLQDPHRVYSPTDLVKGSVCLTIERPLTLIHLVVNLIGRVDLYESSSTGRDNAGGKAWKEWDNDNDYGMCGDEVLCRDEMVLCGEGRLEAGVYEFGFELEFVQVGKMMGGLPSSLDFEKGSISYTISSILTRPTPVSATTICTSKISLLETIDIAYLPRPKPRVISLEPIVSKRSKSKPPSSPSPTIERPSICSTPNSSNSHLPHELSTTSLQPSSKECLKNKTITATVELLKAGGLRGDSIPVKISIRHTKPIKSLNGIIITLHRHTRFEPPPDCYLKHPPLKKTLSSTGAGGGGTFRKDLAQTVMPLIVDPKSLTTVVRANLRIPEDAFPTITTVPGGKVSFRYFIEVVVDLRGKLSGRGDLFSSTTVPGLRLNTEGDGGGGISVEGGVIVVTERIKRREKSVVFCKFEVVVGSVDSIGGKGRLGGVSKYNQPRVVLPLREGDRTGMNDTIEVTPPPTRHQASPAPPLHQSAEYDENGMIYGNPPYLHPEESHPSTELPPILSPLSPPEDGDRNDEMDEKARIRLAEQKLLPSAPPGMDNMPGPSSAAPNYHTHDASAPPLEDHQAFPTNLEFSAPQPPPTQFGPSAPLMQNFSETYECEQERSAHDSQPEDKMELERRRLILSTSAPDGNPGEGSSGSVPAASAPVLDEESEDMGHLPRYKR